MSQEGVDVTEEEPVASVETLTEKMRRLLPHPSKWSDAGEAQGFDIVDLSAPEVDISPKAISAASSYVDQEVGSGPHRLMGYKPPRNFLDASADHEANTILTSHGTHAFSDQSEDLGDNFTASGPSATMSNSDGETVDLGTTVIAPYNITGGVGSGLGIDEEVGFRAKSVVVSSETKNGKTTAVTPGKMPEVENGVASAPGSGAGAIGAVSAKGTEFKVPKPGEASTYKSIADAIKDDPSGILNIVLQMLEEKNIYTPSDSSPFFSGGKDPDEATQGLFTIQRELGRFLPDQENASSPSGTRVTSEDMRRIVKSLLMQATGDFDGAEGVLRDPDASLDANPLEQIGLAGINISKLRLNALGSTDATGEEVGDYTERNAPIRLKIFGASGQDEFITIENHRSIAFRGLDGEPYNGTSHGQLNNYLEPFGNGVLFDALGMLLLAVIACVTIIVIGLIIQGICEAVGNTAKDWKTVPPENLELGRHRVFKPGAGQSAIDFFVEDFMGIPNTDYDFGDALGNGMPMMMGFPPVGIGEMEMNLATGAGILDFAFNLFSSPGYYANYLRTIVMSGQQVGAAFSQIGAGSATQGFEKFFSSLKKIFDSKVVRFVMISAGVGDAQLKSAYGAPGVGLEASLYQLKGVKLSVNPGGKSVKIEYDGQDAAKPNSGKLKINSVNSLRAVAQTRKNVSRWKGNSSKNPLSISTFPSSQVADTRLSSLSSRRRLVASKENVQMMEEALDAEYMPFYFHDLRTNEVVSLPAFVESYDESYAPNYNTTTTYGRQDPVRIYASTERTINLTFKVVAFSEEDYTTMWYTINKFVSMVYPQASKGISRKLDSGGKKIEFIQPFSQVPAASPLIRIRLGDLMKSNYSTSGLKNMFGYSADSESFKADDTQTSKSALKNEKVLAEKIDELKKKNMGPLEQKDLNVAIQKGLRRAEFYVGFPISFKIEESALEALGALFGGGGNDNLDKVATLDFTEKKIIPKPYTMLIAKKGGSLDGASGNFKEDEELKGEFQLINIAGDVADIKLESVPTSIFDKPSVDFGAKHEGQLLKDAKEAADFEGVGTASKGFADQATAFFKSENNAIVRSFESTRGRGLAGFIGSLSFDYSTSTWSTEPNKKGPKSVSISMTFNPVHDLPIGLDSDGRLRSLVYPMGDIVDPRALTGQSFGEVYDTPHEINDATYGDTVRALRKSRLGIDEDKGSGGPF